MTWQSHITVTSVQYIEERKITHNIAHSSNDQYTILYTILHRSTIHCELMWRQVPTLALWHTAYGRILDRLEK